MLGGVLDLRELTVSDIMVHRTNMDAIDAELPTEKIIDLALKSSHTRVPLWRGEREEIIGILHAKTLLRALRDAKGDLSKIDIMALATPPWFVPDTTTLKDQLNAFLKRKAHFAIVVDEYGEVMGLVTLEDIIEEIVGDITDETDIAAALAKPQADGSLIVDGVSADPRRQPADGLGPARRGGDYHRRAGDPRGADHPQSRPGFHLSRLSLRGAEPPAEPHHLVAGDAARGKGSGQDRSQGLIARTAQAQNVSSQMEGAMVSRRSALQVLGVALLSTVWAPAVADTPTMLTRKEWHARPVKTSLMAQNAA